MQKIGYRADIDGLRAIAIIAVLVYHIAPTRLPHGYLGVDIFFVISGYLITGIILRNLQAGTFRLADFFQRRIARLFPALLAMFALVLPLAFIILTKAEFHEFLDQMLAGIFYVSNIYYYFQSGYFEPDALRQPFLHLWSLAVEEQFYLVIPLLLLALFRFSRLSGMFHVLLLFAALSFVAMLSSSGTSYSFYMPWMRAWEFLAGGLLAWALVAHGWKGFPAPASNLLAVAGLAMVLLPMLSPLPHAHPGPFTVLPVLGSMLLIASGNSLLSRHFLANRLAVFIGLVSYPLYIWHYPLLSLSEYALSGGLITRTQKFVFLIIVFALATATWLLLEKRARLVPARTTRLVLPALLLLAIGAAALRIGNVNTLVTDKFLVVSASAARDWNFPGSLHAVPGEERGVHVNFPNRPVEVIFIGDSHAQQYAPRVMHLTRQHPEKTHVISFVTEAGCPPLEGFVLRKGKKCELKRQKIYRQVKQHQSTLEKIIIAGAWNRYMFDHAMLRKRQARIMCDGELRDYTYPGYERCLIHGLKSMILHLRKIAPNAKIVLLQDNPMDQRFSPSWHLQRGNYVSFLLSYRIAHALGLVSSSMSFGDVSPFARQQQQAAFSKRLHQSLQHMMDALHDPASAICPGEICNPLFEADNSPWYKYWDKDHMSATYAQRFEMLDHLFLKSANGSVALRRNSDRKTEKQETGG